METLSIAHILTIDVGMYCYGFGVTIWNGDSREEVAVTCVVLNLLYRERRIICEKADTRMPQSMNLYMRQIISVKKFPEL